MGIERRTMYARPPARGLPSRNGYLVSGLGKETVVHAVVGSIAGLEQAQNPWSQEMSACSKALFERMPPTFLFFPSGMVPPESVAMT